jgi:hypothetical protein
MNRTIDDGPSWLKNIFDQEGDDWICKYNRSNDSDAPHNQCNARLAKASTSGRAKHLVTKHVNNCEGEYTAVTQNSVNSTHISYTNTQRNVLELMMRSSQTKQKVD